jgi:hypothetical protein
MRKSIPLLACAALVLGACADEPGLLSPGDPAFKQNASGTENGQVVYSGQGTYLDGDVLVLGSEVCGVENGAEVDGAYLLWILTANGADGATISGPWGDVTMTKAGGGNSVFKAVTDWYDLDGLIGVVTAEYTGHVRGVVQLVISHGCPPNGGDVGAWCSPGYWGRAADAAWDKTGYDRTDLFNETVYPYWYGATFAADPTLQTVVTTASTYSGPPLAGTSGYALNAFNAVGAMLTDALDGYYFDFDLMGEEDVCPLNNAGDFTD